MIRFNMQAPWPQDPATLTLDDWQPVRLLPAPVRSAPQVPKTFHVEITRDGDRLVARLAHHVGFGNNTHAALRSLADVLEHVHRRVRVFGL